MLTPSRVRKLASAAVSVCALSVLFAVVFCGGSASASGFKVVQGHVYDEDGNLLTGINVKVEMINQTTHLPTATDYSTTESDGMYGVTFDLFSVWETGDTIRVTATYNSVDQVNETTANSGPSQVVDVHFPTAIPQFGSMLGFAVAAGVVCVVGIGFLTFSRKR